MASGVSVASNVCPSSEKLPVSCPPRNMQRQQRRRASGGFCLFFARAVFSAAVAVRTCSVSFVDPRGIRHGCDVEAESLYEAAVKAVARFRQDVWTEQVARATVLDVEIREPATKHSISLQQLERWLAGATSNPNEASRKVKLKMLLMKS